MANNYPTIRPTLSHNYAGMGVLPPDVTFTRASQSGGYYDGRTVSKAEENLFINSVWAGAVSGTPGTVPTSWTSVLNGGSLAVSGAAIEFTALTGTRQAIAQTITVVAGQVITASIDVDAASGTGTDAIAIFEVVSGATLTGTTQILVSGGTGRKSLSATCTVGGTIRVRFGAAVNTNAATDCVVTLKAPQIEIRSFATAYTPTTTAPITNYIPKMLFAATNVPVIDHNPTTGERLGLAIWEARTNLLLYSQEFDNAYWTKSNVTISVNQIIAPDGTLTADKLVEDATLNQHRVLRAIDGSTKTISIYAKAAGRSYIGLFAAVGTRTYFNLSAGTIGTVSSGSTATIESVGNGWYRCTLYNAHPTNAGLFQLSPDGTTETYTGDGYSGVLIWGAQLEAGSFATPYIPTVASTVARSADVAVMTGVNFTRWYRADEGSFVAEASHIAVTGFPAIVTASPSTSSNDQMLLYTTTTATTGESFFVRAGNVIQADIRSGAVVASGVPFKVSGAYKVNDFATSLNGAAVVTDTSGILPANERLTIGASNTSALYLNGYIKSLAYYPARLTNAQLQAITG